MSPNSADAPKPSAEPADQRREIVRKAKAAIAGIQIRRLAPATFADAIPALLQLASGRPDADGARGAAVVFGEQIEAVKTLAVLARTMGPAVDALIHLSGHGHHTLAGQAAAALERERPQLIRARLTAAISADESRVRAAAAGLIDRFFDPAAARTLLVPALTDPDGAVRIAAVRALVRVFAAEFPPPAPPPAQLLPVALLMLRNGAESPVHVADSARLLIRFGAAAVPGLAAMLDDESNHAVTANAAFALGELGMSAYLMLPRLVRLCRHADRGVCRAAEWAVKKIRAAAEV